MDLADIALMGGDVVGGAGGDPRGVGGGFGGMGIGGAIGGVGGVAPCNGF